MDLISFLKKNNSYSALFSRSARIIEKRLDPQEQLLYAMMADSSLTDMLNGKAIATNNFNGTAVITDQRLIFCFKFLGPEVYREVPIEKIRKVEYDKTAFSAQNIKITAPDFVLFMSQAEKTTGEFHAALAEVRKPYVLQKQLDYLNSLLIKGQISEEQYQEQKEKLMKN